MSTYVKEEELRRISLPNNLIWIDPIDSNAVELAKLGMEYMVGRYSHAIHSKEGGWPKAVEEQLLKYSLEHGFRKSKLPAFTEEEKALARGTADFYGLNYYTARVIRPAHGAETGPWFTDGSPEIDAILGPPPNAKTSATPVLPLSPVGLRKILSYIKQEYGDIEIFITENGYAGGKEFSDYNRTEFIRDHLEQVLLAIKEDHVNVSSYTYWSLFDAFEWGSGYT
ncbi:unnamed protein product [Leptosia nina]|uniref:Beta-glucosidase n=1 Tax=Leptosia nina TaxID=320188 RepID=A0AAV1J225_9NEOP